MGGRGLAVVSALALAGCGGGPDPDDLAYDYRSKAPSGEIDQTLTLENRGESGLAPALAITPLDAARDPLKGVRVRTAYGSDRGRLVVPPHAGVIDVLSFEGRGARDVEDVAVSVREVDEVSVEPVAGEPEIQRFDRTGTPVDTAQFFDSFQVANVNEAEIAIRVALIEYEDPPPGEPQQFVRVTALSGLLRLPAHGSKKLRLPEALRGRVIGSVKPYFSR